MILNSKFLHYWLPIILWAGLIFYFSSIPSLGSGFLDTWDWIMRKGAHIFVYAVLTYLLLRALHVGYRMEIKKAALWAAAFSVLYACSDEIHQRYVPGRHGRVRDVAVDAIGIILLVAQVYRKASMNIPLQQGKTVRPPNFS